MKLLITLILVYLLVQSCITDHIDAGSHTPVISVPSDVTDADYFENHFEMAEIIQIQTTDEFLISDIKRLIRHEDQIILLSGKNNTIFIINAKDGKIESFINKVGSGPGESKKILDIAFDADTKTIMIYNDYSRLLLYDTEGNYLSEKKVDGIYEEMSCENGIVYFYNELDGYACYPYRIKALNLSDNTWADIGNDNKVVFSIRSSGKGMVKSKRLWFSAILDFNLYYYENSGIKTGYDLSFPNAENLDENLIKNSNTDARAFFKEVWERQLTYSVNSVRETSDYLVFRSNRGGIFMLNKEEQKIYWDKVVEDKVLGVKLTNYYPHDGDDDKIMFVLSPELYIKQKPANFTHNQKALEVNTDDNPILVFYQQKSN